MPPGVLPRRFTVIAELVDVDYWYIEVLELPGLWTVAFDRDRIAYRARIRIALDASCRPHDFAIDVLPRHGPGIGTRLARSYHGDAHTVRPSAPAP